MSSGAPAGAGRAAAPGAGPAPAAGARRGPVVCLSATEPGRRLAARLPYRHVHGDLADNLRREWPAAGGLVLVVAVGAAVRLVAPLLTDKRADPGVVCVDAAGRYAVAVCGGHAAGANALATEVAGHLGAEPVITTATDSLGVPALDDLPGLAAEGDLATVTAALLAGEAVPVDNDLGWPLPDALRTPPAPTSAPRARIVVTDRVPAPRPPHAAGTHGAGAPPAATVVLRPPSLVAGVGLSTDATGGDLDEALAAALEAGGLSEAAVGALATIDRRAGHPAVDALAARLGVPVTSFDPATLDEVAVPTPSAAVRRAVGTRSVAEAAALLGAGPGAALVVAKRATARTTVAIARRARPPGRVRVVGLGPGAAAFRTPAAERAVRHADVVVGYSGYVEQCRDLLTPAQQVVAMPLGTEVARARTALLEAARGREVAVVCSGDAGVYAMASPLLELAESASTEVEVVPGVTAALAAAALLGAPLGHDHALISLSDLHTPWEVIAHRLQAAASADLVVALYNPRSARRRWQLEAARDILLGARPPSTPAGLVTDAGRPGQRVVVTTLAGIAVDDVTMTTCVVVGASTTRIVGGRMVTPRGYFE